MAQLPNPFARLPSSAKSRIRPSVYGLSKDSAGVQVAFVTNASSIALRWKMFESGGAAEGTVPIALHSGADLYVFDDNSRKWRWAGSATNITLDAGIIGKTIYHQLPMYTPSRAPMDRAYLLNLPMYGSLEACDIGVPVGSPWSLSPLTSKSPVGPGAAMDTVGPIVWYGTSITQGAAASRGMAATNIVSRQLNVEVLNFGFSGNGLLELNVTSFLVQIDASALILDCLHNMHADLVANNTEPLVHAYRKAHSRTPIIFAEGVPYGSSWEGAANPSRKSQLDRRAQFHAAFERLQAGASRAFLRGQRPTLRLHATGCPVAADRGRDTPRTSGWRRWQRFGSAICPRDPGLGQGATTHVIRHALMT